MSTLITNTKYNNLQQRISALLGNSTAGTPQTGYGQTVRSDTHYPITSPESTIITAQQYEDLYIDIVRARVHQVGAANFSIDDLIKGSRTFGTDADKVELSYINSLESLMTTIESNKFEVHGTQLNVENYEPVGGGYTDQRVTSWKTSLTHEFRITFSTVADRRHFFNSGGEIRMQASLTNEANGKADDWAGLLQTAGIVRFGAVETKISLDYNQSVYSSLTVPDIFSIGNYNLSAGYQLLYRKRSNALNNAGTYSSNMLEVSAREINGSTIQFKIEFRDLAGDGNVDNIVIGTVQTLIQSATPNGSVSISGQDYDTVVVPQPIYSLITSISEGS